MGLLNTISQMILKNYKAFTGEHCETTATGSLLYHLGIELSEPMLFGLGESLGYIIWNMKIMDFPFIGGRVKPDALTENLCRNLNLKLHVCETSSLKKAWNNIQGPLSENKVVGLKLDCYHLEYFNTKIHFAGHYVSMYGYDETHAYLNDTNQQGKLVKTQLENLALARSEKGPMSSRNKSFTIEQVEELPDLKKTIKQAIHNNAVEYLNPPIKNLTYKGIKKTASVIKKWFEESTDIKNEFQTAAILMERAGTGGALFRNLYRDFLQESAVHIESKELEKAYQDFKVIAVMWTHVSELFQLIGATKDVKHLNEASDIFIELSEKEKKAMEYLREISKDR